MPNVQENFFPYPTLNMRLSVINGVTAGANLAINGFRAEDVILGVVEFTGAKVSVTTGVTSGVSVAVTGITAESKILEILEVTGAGAGAVTGIADRTGNMTAQGANWVRLNLDTNGDHLIVRYHDTQVVTDRSAAVDAVNDDAISLSVDTTSKRVLVLWHERNP